jgi:LysR family hydrogen peroxide-inducible transcriptional activator
LSGTGGGVTLTPQGQRLEVRARQILHACSLARSDVRGNDTRQFVRLGVLPSLPIDKITAVLQACYAALPNLQIEVREEHNSELIDLLGKDKLDLALMSTFSPRENTDQAILFEEDYMLACPVDHPLARRESIALCDIDNENFVLRTSCEARRATQDIINARGIRTCVVARTAQDDRALRFVAMGVGIALMPALFVAPGVSRVPIRDYKMTRQIVIRKALKARENAGEVFDFIRRINVQHL